MTRRKSRRVYPSFISFVSDLPSRLACSDDDDFSHLDVLLFGVCSFLADGWFWHTWRRMLQCPGCNQCSITAWSHSLKVVKRFWFCTIFKQAVTEPAADNDQNLSRSKTAKFFVLCTTILRIPSTCNCTMTIWQMWPGSSVRPPPSHSYATYLIARYPSYSSSFHQFPNLTLLPLKVGSHLRIHLSPYEARMGVFTSTRPHRSLEK